MRKLAVVLLVAFFLAPGTANAFPTWKAYHEKHTIHVYSVQWENQWTRPLWEILQRNKIAKSYHRFQDKQRSWLASMATPTSISGNFGGSYNGDHLSLLLCIHSHEGGWAANTGNGYWGGLQFAPSTWFGWGGGPFDGTGPFPYSSDYQLNIAEGAGDKAGWSTAWLHGQWPKSSVMCGA